jgi:hypothetical protein
LNWEIVWTVAGVLGVLVFFSPFFLALAIAFEKSRAKIQLEFVATASSIEKKVKFDESIERLFEEGAGQ